MELESAQARKRSTGTQAGTGADSSIPVPVPGRTQRRAAQRNAHHHCCHCGLNRVGVQRLHYHITGSEAQGKARPGNEGWGGDEDGRWEMGDGRWEM
ncbi:hypothetical protein HYFRA_00002779 [Hymenoscyphus fraxineus]|uniref:Uncharacterized protein n=1 Tax=Hymenoscyphus fraxineus TaxID=746836 RepID=A0A9N9PP12_9HELO|nr:hypothetical protein HYFRA_00002779 [Hymenoscyphus fraxineus]